MSECKAVNGNRSYIDPKTNLWESCQCEQCIRIEGLESRIEALEAQLAEREWVKVKDWQPDLMQFLAFDGDEVFFAVLHHPEEIIEDRYEGVTHWMPLPEPPKGEARVL